MRLRNSSIVRLLLVLASLAGMPAVAADQAFSTEAPFSPQAAAETLRLAPGAKSALRIELGEADAAGIEAVRKANSAQFNKKLQIGVGRDVPGDAKSRGASLQWQSVAGGHAAQWEVVSTGARALRVELEAGKLPAGFELRFASAARPATVYGPFTAADIRAMGARYWSPVLEGDRAIVEAFLPAAKFSELPLSVTRVSHLFASPSDADMVLKAAGDSQFCEIDLICRSASDSALASTGRAVARMTFSDGVSAGTYNCTGTLLNTTAGPVAPYFYSANHCISTQASANTLTTHWFFDRQNCGSGSTVSSYTQVTGGAALLYNNATTDVLLLRLNQNPPANAVYAGWNSNPLSNGTSLTAVHHPAGDWKKVSLGSAGGFSAYGGGTGDTHLIALWNSTSTGVTEGGSSGSGIFTFDGSGYQLRGGLHGGPSSCSASGVDLRDYYSRFDRAYSFLASYLAPSSTCTYSLSPTSATVGSGGGSGSFTVTTQSGCSWSASSSASWLTSGSSGSGSGTASYTAAANSGAARTGTITVGGQSFTVTQQASSGGTTSELVSNGGFESGGSGWTQSSTSGLSVIYTDGSASRTGNGYAWLGGYNSGTDAIQQNVTIPAGASPVTLRFWYRITTNDSPLDAYDVLRVMIQNASTGTTLATVATLSNQNSTSGWVQSSAIDLSGYAGQTIRLRFEATMDSSLTTNFYLDDVTITAATSGGTGSNYTGLWYNFPAESEAGWGINFTHQGDIVFATLFTYDAGRAPLWLVMPAGQQQAGTNTFTGTLYRTRGPAFNAVPFVWSTVPNNLTDVGTMTVTFTASDRATLSYTLNGVSVTKTVTKQVYGTRAANCVNTTGSRAGLTNYQDLWYNSPAESEPGWGVNVTHQDNTLFATLFTYDSTGRDLWLVMSDGRRQANGSYTGTLFQTSGPVFNASPFTGVNANPVGSMTFSFSNGENGTLTYTYNGVTVVKAITRQVFRSSVPACS